MRSEPLLEHAQAAPPSQAVTRRRKSTRGEGQMYRLLNKTDGVLASPKAFKTASRAKSCAEKMRKLFVNQGYYLTVEGKRIAPEEVEFAVVIGGETK